MGMRAWPNNLLPHCYTLVQGSLTAWQICIMRSAPKYLLLILWANILLVTCGTILHWRAISKRLHDRILTGYGPHDLPPKLVPTWQTRLLLPSMLRDELPL